MGRLSNPPETLKSLVLQGSMAKGSSRRPSAKRQKWASQLPQRGSKQEEGRLSNPVQRRLDEAAIDEIVSLYLQGLSIAQLATHLSIHRTTVFSHLDNRGVTRRRIERKLSDEQVAAAAERYKGGLSLALVAAEYNVHERTLTREFRRAGVATRTRRG